MIPDFSASRVLVVGDIMLDRYVYGNSDRISPEAPVPVLTVEHEESRIGGAGTVLRNIAALGGQTTAVAVVGNDSAGNEITRLVGELPGVEAYLITEQDRITSVKIRHLAGHHQIARVDYETTDPLKEATAEQVLWSAREAVAECDAVVLSDYDKGTLSCDVAKQIIREARRQNVPVVVDSKSDLLSCMAGATVFTPNLGELSKAIENGRLNSRESVIEAAQKIIRERSLSNVLATRGRDGMILQTRDGKTYDYAATATGVVDVTGAGDTVVAVLSLALAAGLSLPEAANLSNIAGGLVVGKVGSATIGRDELMAVTT